MDTVKVFQNKVLVCDGKVQIGPCFFAYLVGGGQSPVDALGSINGVIQWIAPRRPVLLAKFATFPVTVSWGTPANPSAAHSIEVLVTCKPIPSFYVIAGVPGGAGRIQNNNDVMALNVGPVVYANLFSGTRPVKNASTVTINGRGCADTNPALSWLFGCSVLE